MATNIPPHNLGEIMSALKKLLRNEDLSIDDLMEDIPGPDFPTGGIIYGIKGIHSAYKRGRGIIQIRAKTEIEITKNEKERIVITELPYQVNKAKLVERIAELVISKQIVGISDIRDESSREGIRVCLDVKKGEMGSVILNRLFKHTNLQTSFGTIFLSLIDGIPKVMNLKEQLGCFIIHRKEVIVRRTAFELKKAREKIHILEGLKTAVDNLDAIVALVRKAAGPKEAKGSLQEKYSLSPIQAQAILDMKLQRLTGLEREKIVEDYFATEKEIERLKEILDSEEVVKNIIEEEFDQIIEKYTDERRTVILPADLDDIQTEDLIKKEDVVVTITHKGYVKRMEKDTYKTQRRGGKGVKGASSEDDFFTHIFIASTHSTLFIFTDRGKIFAKKVYEIPEAKRTSKGRNIANLIQLPAGEKIRGVVCLPEEIEDKYLFFATEKGIIKKTKLSDYKNTRATGLKAIKIDDDDSLLRVQITNGSKDVLLCSSSGKIIRFAESDCRTIGRVSRGVKGITLNKQEKVIGMEIIDDSVEILSITEKGYGKRTDASQYRRQSRGGKGVVAMKLTQKTGFITDIKSVTDKNDLMIITDNGQVIRISISDVSILGRATQGVRMINVKGNEKVVAIEQIIESE